MDLEEDKVVCRKWKNLADLEKLYWNIVNISYLNLSTILSQKRTYDTKKETLSRSYVYFWNFRNLKKKFIGLKYWRSYLVIANIGENNLLLLLIADFYYYK